MLSSINEVVNIVLRQCTDDMVVDFVAEFHRSSARRFISRLIMLISQAGSNAILFVSISIGVIAPADDKSEKHTLLSTILD